jgi:hypothetical protein
MVTIKYKGHRSFFARTDGGLSVAFNPNEVHTFDENHKRYKEFCKRLLTQPDLFEVQSKVGTRNIGGGVRTRSKNSRPKSLGKGKQAVTKEIKSPKSLKSKVQAKVDKALKKPRGLRRPKRKIK